jgi:hypothetical protein
MDDGTHIENNWEADWDLAEQTAHDIEVDQHINSQRGKNAIWYVAVCGRQQARLAIPGLANLVALLRISAHGGQRFSLKADTISS